MGTLFVDKLDPQSGTSLELGSSGDTVAVNTGATTNLAGNVTLGASGKTITVPAGATITNNGTATGFGGSAGNIYFLARRGNSGQTISNDTFTTVQMDTEMEDSGSVFDPSTYKFTPGVVGKYFVFAQVAFSVTNATDWTQGTILLDKNDAGYTDTNLKNSMAFITRRSSGSGTSSFYVSQIFTMDADDTIRVQFHGNWSGASSSQTVGYGKSYFGGFQIA